MAVTISGDAVPAFLIRAHELACRGRSAEALACLTESNLCQLRDQADTDAHIVLGQTWRLLGRLREAAQCYEQVTDKQPDAVILLELAGLYCEAGHFFCALRSCEKALLMREDWTELKALYALCLMKTGKLEEGMDLLKRTVNNGQAPVGLHSQYLFHLHYMPDIDAKTVLREYQRWAALFAPAHLARTGHANTPDPARKLRIGYLSPDFRRHSVTYTFEALLDGRNPAEAEVYGYGSVTHPDETTERLKGKFDAYRDILKLDNRGAADLIERDKIDILVALAGHTTGHRLVLLGYKSAPIQVDMGSLATTGMEQIDYRLTDQWLDPPDTQDDCAEAFVYLPGGSVCYRPAQNSPAVAAPPVLKNGYITFGSFNNLLKVNDDTMGLWARVLQAVPDSRLLLKFHGSHDRRLVQAVSDRFAQHCISKERLQFMGYCASYAEHMQCFHAMDIALDTYPFNGGVTSLEGLWMGVPLISLTGRSFTHRTGFHLLTQIGLGSFAAQTAQAYVLKAAALAGQIPSLTTLRGSLRTRMQTSTLCDPRRYARQWEAACRCMWTRWCETQRCASGALIGT